jgi:hypothetical protein
MAINRLGPPTHVLADATVRFEEPRTVINSCRCGQEFRWQMSDISCWDYYEAGRLIQNQFHAHVQLTARGQLG